MASQPPNHFVVETESKGSSNNNNHQKWPCKLCRVDRKKFICKNCLRSGNYISSNNNNDSERFIDKQHKLKNLKNAQKLQEENFHLKFKNFIRLENLRTSILEHRSRNTILHELIKEKRETIQKLQDIKKENHDKNRAQRIILPKYEDKVNKLGDYVMEAVEKNDNLRKKSHEQMEQLKNLRRSYIDKLVKFIFPMSHQTLKSGSLHHSRKPSNESLQPDAISEIAEAMMTSGVKSGWGNDNLNDLVGKNFVIVAPSLPSNGNYQEYIDWIHSNKDGTVVVSSGTNELGNANNSAYRIAAALTYVAQLVQALSFYLDIRLPHKVSYNDFCTMGLNEQQFQKKVARLNLNIVYLCYTQNLLMRNIQPARTMENIFQLLDIRNVDLGRTGPVLDTSQRSVDSIMQSFTDIFDDEHSDSDDDSDDVTLQKDWENIGNLPLVDITQSTMVQQQSASMAGTIMNVAHSLSFWKWK
ncbi:CLUMA_CG002616, isoform A [Clunio marinus]|uniref:CLUMA_CG002616, isoform A n=1 Tax=Clunio marinus TaxID=568069 RepID=A0A1J1HM17_9DIPT|nr:CLUMA_CG002616, isoform A [Clunio marinus]